MAKHLRVTISEAEVALQLGTGTFAIGKVSYNVTVIGDGRKTVTTAGLREQLSTISVPCEYVLVSPIVTNTGVIAVGGTLVAATATQQRGNIILPGDIPLPIVTNNLNTLYLSATIAGDGISFTYGA